MTASPAIRPAVPFLGRIAAALRPSTTARPAPDEAPHEADVSRRAFINDMLSANPDAFASEFDVQMMLGHFPRDF